MIFDLHLTKMLRTIFKPFFLRIHHSVIAHFNISNINITVPDECITWTTENLCKNNFQLMHVWHTFNLVPSMCVRECLNDGKKKTI